MASETEGASREATGEDGAARIVMIGATLAGVALAVHQLFNIQAGGILLIEGSYLYALGGLFLAMAYLTFGVTGQKGGRVPGYDWLLAALSILATGYFAVTAEQSLEEGWEYAPPMEAEWAALLLWLLILEATRRAGGTALFAIVALFSLYPTFADQVPNPLNGFAQPFWSTIPYHMLSAESAFGIPMKAFGNLVIGFILFGAVLASTGGGRFFNDLALGLVGQYRGGAAKVAIFASGFMGSMSGSVISNVLTTGAVSIPAMKRTGFSPPQAAAAEACASTGGVLMPPIMGATAFVMASFLGRPYVEIALAAAIPSALFYFGLFAQIDALAARRGLSGLPRAELPRLGRVALEGWPYLAVFGVLIFMMVALRQDTLAPFWAVLLLLAINQLLRRHRFTWRTAGDTVLSVGRALAELTAVLLGVGLIVGAFSATGLAGTLVNDLVFMAGGSTIALLLMGALTAFVFGMGMTVTACYIFLAVVLAPALEQAGLNPLAVHLFILYWGMVSYITPPVALGAFSAATLAGAAPLSAGLAAMRLGAVIYLAPFIFVLNPALVGEGSAFAVMGGLAMAVAAVWCLASALQGHLSLVGSLGEGASGAGLRLSLFAAALVFAAAGSGATGISAWLLAPLGAALAAGPLAIAYSRHPERARPA
ncbi:MAG: TRAP transporter fused permease subunit [Pseudomonadota bacterium]